MPYVIKANGEKEEFSEKKLIDSAKRAGVPEEMQREMVNHVKMALFDGISTSDVYNHIKEYLGGRSEPHYLAKYSLKQAIMDLGPTGYPFENYIARILQKEGFVTQLRTLLRGRCVTHEIDVIAEKSDDTHKKMMIEAKFHNKVGIKTEVQVALYTYARFEDIKVNHHFDHALLITNTKTTTDAIAYAQCMGMHVISWEYPHGGSLRELVEKYNLYPITVLLSLSESEKQYLFTQDVILCSDIVENATVLHMLPLSQEKKQQVFEEASEVLQAHPIK